MNQEPGKRAPLGPEDVLTGSDPAVAEFVRSLGIDQPETVRRVVLDLAVNEVVIAYVERYVSRKKLEIVTAGKRPEVREVE